METFDVMAPSPVAAAVRVRAILRSGTQVGGGEGLADRMRARARTHPPPSHGLEPAPVAAPLGVGAVEIWNIARDADANIAYAETMWNRGYRFGVVAASDNHFRELRLISGPGTPRTGRTKPPDPPAAGATNLCGPTPPSSSQQACGHQTHVVGLPKHPAPPRVTTAAIVGSSSSSSSVPHAVRKGRAEMYGANFTPPFSVITVSSSSGPF